MSFRCEGCGERFTSRMNFENHRDLVDCTGPAGEAEGTTGAEPGADSTADASTDTPVDLDQSLPQRGVTGTVQMYDEERGFGFLTTADVTRPGHDDAAYTVDVFFHVSDVSGSNFAEGDRLRFDVVQGDEGPKCVDGEVVERGRGRGDEREGRGGSDPAASRLGFGTGKDDGRYGPGKAEPTESDIESFDDERKFR